MNQSIKINLIVSGFDGTGYKQAAEVRFDGPRFAGASAPAAARIEHLIRRGSRKGSVETQHATISFEVVGNAYRV